MFIVYCMIEKWDLVRPILSRQRCQESLSRQCFFSLILMKQNGLPSFRQRGLSSLNVPRRYHLPLILLRTLSLLPSLLGAYHNTRSAYNVPIRDSGGALVLKSTQSDFWIANFWVRLSLYLLKWTRLFTRVFYLVCFGWLLELDPHDQHDASLAVPLRDQQCHCTSYHVDSYQWVNLGFCQLTVGTRSAYCDMDDHMFDSIGLQYSQAMLWHQSQVSPQG